MKVLSLLNCCRCQADVRTPRAAAPAAPARAPREDSTASSVRKPAAAGGTPSTGTCSTTCSSEKINLTAAAELELMSSCSEIDVRSASLGELLRLAKAVREAEPPLLPAPRPSPRSQAPLNTLVLDLDETLVHSSFFPTNNAAFVIDVTMMDATYKIYVAKRPGVDEFLRLASQYYEVVLFTASLSEYAKPLLDLLDPEHAYLHHRLFRDSCLSWQANYVKDLARLGRDLRRTLIVDNSHVSSLLQPNNAITVRSWFGDLDDTELFELMPIIQALSKIDNIPALVALSSS